MSMKDSELLEEMKKTTYTVIHKVWNGEYRKMLWRKRQRKSNGKTIVSTKMVKTYDIFPKEHPKSNVLVAK